MPRNSDRIKRSNPNADNITAAAEAVLKDGVPVRTVKRQFEEKALGTTADGPRLATLTFLLIRLDVIHNLLAMRLDLILYHQPDIERNMGSETNLFENDNENVADVKKSVGKHPSFIENQEENIFKTLNFGNDFQHNHEYFNEATIQQLEEKPKLCDKNDNIIDNSATTLNPLNVQDQKSNLNEQIFQDHNSFKNPEIISACEVKPEDPYRGSVRLVRLQAASCNTTEPLHNAGCDVTLQNSSGVIVSSEDPNKRMCPEEMKDVTENQIVCSDVRNF
ncbi:hypothetical protein TNCT_326171 [Trichonephila clavata]|uniref:Uncharacterized protein n=1 Tax=Trichonephila clavata TaxID=2740835 RepID=A0A8X6J9R1_TRICU|nr:hypothetical protein TNCT_326171 [Trichonephila clavata]